MRSTRKIKTSDPVASVASKSFFGATQSSSFFSAPVGLQKQTAPAKALAKFSVPDFKKAFPIFDFNYNVAGPVPNTGTLFIVHRVHMKYPKAMSKSERTTFESDFVKSVHDKWSNKHLLSLTEPGFSLYQCNVDVSAKVVADAKDAQTVITVVKPVGADRIRSNVSGNRDTARLDYRDPTIETSGSNFDADLIKDVGNFDFDSATINQDCQKDIDEIISYINTIPKNPAGSRFSVTLIGRASSEGTKSYNKKLSERRIDAVSQILGKLPGIDDVVFTVAAGESGATASSEFRKVTVGIVDETKNKPANTPHNVATHEFGHMIGLGDEYPEEEPGKSKEPTFLGDKPRFYESIKELIDEDAANELVLKRSPSIMSAGNEVRRGHYITFVAAMNQMTRPEIEHATGNKNAKWSVL